MTQYLAFQVFTSSDDPRRPPDCDRCTSPPGADALVAFISSMKARIGMVGDPQRCLAFTLGPIAFDHTDQEVVALIQTGFALARHFDMAVCFHVDDSMFWGRWASVLAAGNVNVEWRDWKGTPNTGRRLDWGAEPLRAPPQMDYTSLAIRSIAHARAGLIGRTIESGMLGLRSVGKEHLYAGVIAGWETQFGRDFETGDALGYAGMMRWGITSEAPPASLDEARGWIVRWWMQYWAQRLKSSGAPADKIYCHIALATPGLRFAFSPGYRPGFSMYPEAGAFEVVHAALRAHGSPPWACAEGTNVIPNGSPGEPSMARYLGRHFAYNASLVNLFGWGIGDASNPFRRVTEADESIEAYRAFLLGEGRVGD